MYPALIEPAAAAGATAAHMALSALHNPMTPSASGPSTSGNFSALLASVQTQGVQGLVGLKGGDLQQVISSMSSQQKLSLSQQLMGSKVTVENGGGQLVQGVASQLQFVNGTPTFNVAGKTYNLENLRSVLQTSAVA